MRHCLKLSNSSGCLKNQTLNTFSKWPKRQKALIQSRVEKIR